MREAHESQEIDKEEITSQMRMKHGKEQKIIMAWTELYNWFI